MLEVEANLIDSSIGLEKREATQCETYLEAHLKAVKTMLGVLEPEEIGKFIDKVLIGAEILRGKE